MKGVGGWPSSLGEKGRRLHEDGRRASRGSRGGHGRATSNEHLRIRKMEGGLGQKGCPGGAGHQKARRGEHQRRRQRYHGAWKARRCWCTYENEKRALQCRVSDNLVKVKDLCDLQG